MLRLSHTVSGRRARANPFLLAGGRPTQSGSPACLRVTLTHCVPRSSFPGALGGPGVQAEAKGYQFASQAAAQAAWLCRWRFRLATGTLRLQSLLDQFPLLLKPVDNRYLE